MNNKCLSDEEKSLLLKCLEKYAPNLISKYNQLETELLSPDDINAMREAVGQELMVKGFTMSSQPNKYGFQLEYLIDRIADLYLWPEKYENQKHTKSTWLKRSSRILKKWFID